MSDQHSLLKAILTLVAFLLFIGVPAQNYKRRWSEGKLSLEAIPKRRSGDSLCSISYQLEYHLGKTKVRDTIVRSFQADGYVDLARSWILSGSESGLLLRYIEVIRALVEVHRRKLQDELTFTASFRPANDLLSHELNGLNLDLRRFASESRSGSVDSVISKWELLTAGFLSAPEPDLLPPFRRDRFSIGLSFGTGVAAFAGEPARGLPLFPLFAYGFDFGYGRHLWIVNAALSGGAAKNRLGDIQEGSRVGYAFGDAAWGWIVRDDHGSRIAPFVGISVTEVGDTSVTYHSYNAVAGLLCEFKLRRGLNVVPEWNRHEFYFTRIGTRLFISYADLGGAKGVAVNFSVTFGFSASFLRIR